ncbi:MAG: S8 family peptidase [Clostridium sp.]|uniref:S8 family peptidase n=1 Tax=Clostridium sp. TaxID=1506 RepID=UPI00303A2C52
MFNSRACNLYYDPTAANYLIEYHGNFKEQIDKVTYACGYIINDTLGIIAVPSNLLNKLLKDVPAIIFVDFRAMFILEDISPSYVDNINTIKVNPYLNLTGRGVVIGMVDSGIDYLNEEFIREDGTSRILNIWDQSVPNTNPSLYIGETYSNEQINNAINAHKRRENPYEIVPSKDTIGHGTKTAGIIGARGYTPELQGIANDSDFVIVKLFESSNFKKQLDENQITPSPPVYNTSEVVSALEYLKDFSIISKKPMVIYLGVGSTEGSHDGLNMISRYLTSLGSIRGIALVAGVGNQGAAQGHTSGYIKNVGDIKIIELIIPREIKYFSFNIWVQKPNRASLTIISPTGESSNLIKSKIGKIHNFKFVFVNTETTVSYYTPEYFTGHEVINIIFGSIKPGIWQFQLLGDYISDGRYDIWLPPENTLPDGTKFLEPDPFITLTIPSTAINVVTVAYYGENNSLVSTSGKGFNSNNLINPDVATLGLNILTTKASGGITTISGSSAAAAIAAGVCSLLLEWGIIHGNDTTMYSKKITSYLIYGAYRNPIFTYPNRDTGFGDLDLLGTFNVISKSFSSYTRGLYIDNIKVNSPKKDKFLEYYVDNLFIRISTEIMEDLK